jgi:alanine-synthesizing transaminase
VTGVQTCALPISLLERRLRGCTAAPLAAEGGWTAVLRLPAVREDAAVALDLLDRGVLVQPGYFYDFEGTYLVVSLLTPPETLAEGLEAIARL